MNSSSTAHGIEQQPSLYSWYVVTVLMVLYIFSFLDRTIIVLLSEQIKEDLQISDTQIGLLYGFGFAIFYTILGVPLARMADVKNRRNLIVAGVFVWSLMTALCGASKNFIQLFACRVGVGAGEAALSPAAYSLISDYFRPEKRAQAMSVYTMGVYLGAGLAVLLGGLVIEWVATAPSVTLPVVGELFTWQLTFIIVGAPGLFLGLLVFTIKEPKRGTKDPVTLSNENHNTSFKQALIFFYQRRGFFLNFCFGAACLVMYSYAMTAWTPAFFIRTHDWSLQQVSWSYGWMLLICGPSGVIFGGWLASRLRRQGKLQINAQIALFSLVMLIIPASIAPLLDNPWAALGVIGLIKFLCGMPLGVTVAALHDVTPNHLRAQATAIYLFVINLVGMGFGPTAVALVTDYYLQDPSQIRYSLAWVGTGACIIGAVLIARAQKPYKALYAQQLQDTNH